jgi:hypothetical protein
VTPFVRWTNRMDTLRERQIPILKNGSGEPYLLKADARNRINTARKQIGLGTQRLRVQIFILSVGIEQVSKGKKARRRR